MAPKYAPSQSTTAQTSARPPYSHTASAMTRPIVWVKKFPRGFLIFFSQTVGNF